jgi:hypothetical protein
VSTFRLAIISALRSLDFDVDGPMGHMADSQEVVEEQADAIVAALLALPVKKRMEAMGMEHRVDHDGHNDGQSCWHCEDVWVE